MAKSDEKSSKKGWLLVSLSTNLGLLSFFKYGGFLLENTQIALAQVGIHYSPPEWSIILPMGISFYTFQTISYTIDVYRKELKPWPHFVDFAMYVTFFPQLVAGPIVRAVDFLPQCLHPRKATAQQLGWGLCLITIGLFEKNVLADALLAPVADEIYNGQGIDSFIGAWVGTLAFSGQIFCDFAGYSSCGIGTGLCLGFVLPDNFRFPYAAIGFSDFWRRWHISLSSWLRDYLYIPLGGNRHGAFKRSRNLVLTMLLGGLWHGAAWRFIAWGALHGFYLMAEARLTALLGGLPLFRGKAAQICLGILTYALVCVSWVFFRASDFSIAYTVISSMCGLGGGEFLMTTRAVVAIAIVVMIVILHWGMRLSSVETVMEKLNPVLTVILLTACLLGIILIHGEDRAFIYFQF
jgi:D-alanyl-lipoteichoic acid acyltransferase DltB (MBOAT superfamily)